MSFDEMSFDEISFDEKSFDFDETYKTRDKHSKLISTQHITYKTRDKHSSLFLCNI